MWHVQHVDTNLLLTGETRLAALHDAGSQVVVQLGLVAGGRPETCWDYGPARAPSTLFDRACRPAGPCRGFQKADGGADVPG
jgi:hypothetical protein